MVDSGWVVWFLGPLLLSNGGGIGVPDAWDDPVTVEGGAVDCKCVGC